MQLARIDGSVIATVAHPSLRGHRLAICQPIDDQGREEGAPVIAVDPLGAGLHQRVLFHTDGGATRDHVGDQHSPLRNLVCAIVDPTALAP